MKEQLLSILNENSAELTVEKAMKIAYEIVVRDKQPNGETQRLQFLEFANKLLQSFESFKKIRLEKGQFVFDEDFEDEGMEAIHANIAMNALQKKVIFAGFNVVTKNTTSYSDKVSLHFKPYEEDYCIIDLSTRKSSVIEQATIGDLLTEISRYNRTAKEPINLKFTENIIPLLGVKI